jgi:hypothetical protein
MDSKKFMEENYGLKGRPFEDKIARKTWLETWVDREEQKKEWNSIIIKSISSNKNFMTFIIGDYGQGKTLSLLKIIEKAKEYKEIFPIFMNFKGEERTKPGLDFILRIFKSIDFNKFKEDKSEKLSKAIDSLPVELEETKILLNKIYSEEEETRRLALYFLRGEIKPSQKQLKKLEILRKIDNIDIAKEYLAGILVFAQRLGYTNLLLAIDEFEYLFSLIPKSQQSIYIALLRGLYDFPIGIINNVRDVANMTFFIAVSESGWVHLNDLEKKEMSTGGPIVPLKRRIDSKITLGSFDKKQTRELIKERLSYNRIEGKYQDRPLIPFEDDFVDFIHEETQGVLEKIIIRCDHVLDAGLAARIPLIDKNFAQKALKERNF